MTAAPHKFETLDALRGVAALAVVVYHFRADLFGSAESPFGIASGRLAVDLFFLLSGFVIAFAYDPKLRAGMGTARFIKLRLIRLLPMVWVGTAIGAALLFAQGGMSTPAIVTAAAFNAVMLPAPMFKLFPTNGPAWSLFYEMIANVAFALFFPWLTRRNLLLAIAGFLCAAILVAWYYGHLRHANGWRSPVFGIPRVGFSFCLGVALARSRAVWQPRMPRLPTWSLCAATAVLLCVPVEGVAKGVYNIAFIAIASPLLVMLGSVVEPSRKGAALAATAGALSYPIYAIHRPIHYWTIKLCADLGLPIVPTSIAVIIALVPLSLFLARHYDMPVRAWLTRKAAGRRIG